MHAGGNPASYRRGEMQVCKPPYIGSSYTILVPVALMEVRRGSIAIVTAKEN